MVERFHQIGDRLFAVLSNGDLLVSAIGEWQWNQIFSDVPKIRAISTMS
jgi:hypothetical protein